MRKISAIISISSFSSQLYYIGYQKNAKEQPLQKNIPFQLDKKLGNKQSLKSALAMQSWHLQQDHIYYNAVLEWWLGYSLLILDCHMWWSITKEIQNETTNFTNM